ncbi:hypothetical protein V8E55_004736 [Tylopilus felleus]
MRPASAVTTPAPRNFQRRANTTQTRWKGSMLQQAPPYLEKNQVRCPGRDAVPLLHSPQDRDACDVDLHRQRVKEAIDYAKKAITIARRRAEPKVRLIVGQGKHSEGGIPRLKLAVRKGLQSRRHGGHRVDVVRRNAGVLIVRLDEAR